MVDEKQTDLRRALERDEIVPFFQPLLYLRTGFAAATVLPGHLPRSVNISLAQLAARSLLRYIRHAAQHGQFPLHRLILEITESALIGNPELASLIANELKEQGSRLALDD